MHTWFIDILSNWHVLGDRVRKEPYKLWLPQQVDGKVDWPDSKMIEVHYGENLLGQWTPTQVYVADESWRRREERGLGRWKHPQHDLDIMVNRIRVDRKYEYVPVLSVKDAERRYSDLLLFKHSTISQPGKTWRVDGIVPDPPQTRLEWKNIYATSPWFTAPGGAGSAYFKQIGEIYKVVGVHEQKISHGFSGGVVYVFSVSCIGFYAKKCTGTFYPSRYLAGTSPRRP